MNDARKYLYELMQGIEGTPDLLMCGGGRALWNWYRNWKRENHTALVDLADGREEQAAPPLGHELGTDVGV